MTSSLHPEWDAAREFRAILLRFVAFAILLANLLLGGSEGAEGTHLFVVVSYFLISVASVVTVRLLPGRSWLKTLFVILDALLVTSLCAHTRRTGDGEPQSETTSLVVAFLLLVHIGLKLDRLLVLIFSGIRPSRDHDRTRREALKADQRRLNLSRFFSPFIVSELQERGETLGLERRNAAIMFVDLRDFTSSAETAPARNWR